MNEHTRLAQSAVCATCRRRLIPYEDVDASGSVTGTGWHHPQMVPGVECNKLVPILFDGDDRAPDQVSVCDFCGVPGISWDYPAESFMCPGDPTYSFTGAWTACEACHRDIEERRWEAMARRQCEVFGMDPDAVAVAHFVGIFVAFDHHRCGPGVKA